MKDLLLRVPTELYAEIEDYRWKNRLPSNTDALRQLLRFGLDAEK